MHNNRIISSVVKPIRYARLAYVMSKQHIRSFCMKAFQHILAASSVTTFNKLIAKLLSKYYHKLNIIIVDDSMMNHILQYCQQSNICFDNIKRIDSCDQEKNPYDSSHRQHNLELILNTTVVSTRLTTIPSLIITRSIYQSSNCSTLIVDWIKEKTPCFIHSPQISLHIIEDNDEDSLHKIMQTNPPLQTRDLAAKIESFSNHASMLNIFLYSMLQSNHLTPNILPANGLFLIKNALQDELEKMHDIGVFHETISAQNTRYSFHMNDFSLQFNTLNQMKIHDMLTNNYKKISSDLNLVHARINNFLTRANHTIESLYEKLYSKIAYCSAMICRRNNISNVISQITGIHIENNRLQSANKLCKQIAHSSHLNTSTKTFRWIALLIISLYLSFNYIKSLNNISSFRSDYKLLKLKSLNGASMQDIMHLDNQNTSSPSPWMATHAASAMASLYRVRLASTFHKLFVAPTISDWDLTLLQVINHTKNSSRSLDDFINLYHAASNLKQITNLTCLSKINCVNELIKNIEQKQHLTSLDENINDKHMNAWTYKFIITNRDLLSHITDSSNQLQKKINKTLVKASAMLAPEYWSTNPILDTVQNQQLLGFILRKQNNIDNFRRKIQLSELTEHNPFIHSEQGIRNINLPNFLTLKQQQSLLYHTIHQNIKPQHTLAGAPSFTETINSNKQQTALTIYALQYHHDWIKFVAGWHLSKALQTSNNLYWLEQSAHPDSIFSQLINLSWAQLNRNFNLHCITSNTAHSILVIKLYKKLMSLLHLTHPTTALPMRCSLADSKGYAAFMQYKTNYLQQIASLYDQIQHIINSKQPQKNALAYTTQFMLQQQHNALLTSSKSIQSLVNTLPDTASKRAFKHFLMLPLSPVWHLLTQLSQTRLKQLWKNTFYQPFTQLLASHYPLNPTATKDADFDTMNSWIFSKTSHFKLFLDKYLTPFIIMPTQGTWSLHKIHDFSLMIPRRILSALKNMDHLVTLLNPNGQPFIKLHLAIQAVPNPHLDYMRLNFAKTSFSYFNGPVSWQPKLLSFPQQPPYASLRVRTNNGTWILLKQHFGQYAELKLLHDAKWDCHDAQQFCKLTWIPTSKHRQALPAILLRSDQIKNYAQFIQHGINIPEHLIADT